VRVLT